MSTLKRWLGALWRAVAPWLRRAAALLLDDAPQRDVGGLIPGALSVLEGPSGSGKTEQAWRVAMGAAANGPVLFIDADGDGPRGSRDALWFMRPEGADQALHAAITFCRIGAGGAIIIDSLSGLLPDRAAANRFCTRQLPRLIGAAYAGDVALLITHNPLLGTIPQELVTYAVEHRIERKPSCAQPSISPAN